MRLSLILLSVAAACAAPPKKAVVKAPSEGITRSAAVPTLEPPKDDRLDPKVRPTAYQVRLDLDPRRADYGGQVRIDLELSEATDTIWLHSEKHEIYAHGLTVANRRVKGSSIARGGPDWLAIKTPKAIGPGKASLLLQFRGEMTTPLFGLYRVEHAGAWYIYTQFESLGARKAFPCFDEPDFKATFTLQIRSPKENPSFANAPLAQKPTEQGPWVRHVFKTTPPLPTYLIAMAVGPIDIAHDPAHDLKRADGSTLRIRVLTPKGKSKLATLALRETKKILALEEAYFGTPYPFAKLDLVAVPDFAAGAMENPGLITYRDRLLLMDEATVTQAELMSYAYTHAHELAHIWFGDLVTMRWWDDLWLNEAFATWFGWKIVDQYRPDWKYLMERIGSKTWVMDVDSTNSARRIREPIKTRGDIENAFDGITYTKGAAVLQMFEGYIGEEAFKQGVRAYLKANAWGNATFADLASALAKSSGKPNLPRAFGTFIDQAGVPLVDLKSKANGSVELSQQRWAPLGKEELKAGSWELPFCVQKNGSNEQVCTLLTEPTELQVGQGTPLPNPGMQGYAVWRLENADLERLLNGFSSLSEMQQVATLQNLRKLYRSGDLSPSTILKITPDLLKSQYHSVIYSALSLQGELGRLVDAKQVPAFRKLRDQQLGDLVERYGWGEPGETNSAQLKTRRLVLAIAGISGKRPAVVEEARRRAETFLEGKSVPRETLGTALSITAESGDEALFDRVQKAFLETDDIQRRRPLRSALTGFRFEGIVERLFALIEHKQLRANERGTMIWAVSGDYRTRDEAWRRLKPMIPKLNKILPRRGARYLPYYPVSACRADLEPELDTIFTPWLSALDGMDRHLKTAKERLGQCLGLRSAYGDELTKILAP